MATARGFKGATRKRGTRKRSSLGRRKAPQLRTIKSKVKGATVAKKRSTRAKRIKGTPGNVTVTVNGKTVHKS